MSTTAKKFQLPDRTKAVEQASEIRERYELGREYLRLSGKKVEGRPGLLRIATPTGPMFISEKIGWDEALMGYQLMELAEKLPKQIRAAELRGKRQANIKATRGDALNHIMRNTVSAAENPTEHHKLVKAELIARREERGVAPDERKGISWREYRRLLLELGKTDDLDVAFAQLKRRAARAG